MCILSCPTSSITNCKTCTYSADNFVTHLRILWNEWNRFLYQQNKPKVCREDLWIIWAVVQVVRNCVIVKVILAGFTYPILWNINSMYYLHGIHQQFPHVATSIHFKVNWELLSHVYVWKVCSYFSLYSVKHLTEILYPALQFTEKVNRKNNSLEIRNTSQRSQRKLLRLTTVINGKMSTWSENKFYYQQ